MLRAHRNLALLRQHSYRLVHGQKLSGSQHHHQFSVRRLKHKVKSSSSTSPSSSASSSRATRNSNAVTGKELYFAACLAWYSKKLDTHPITTKCLSSGLIAAGGDLICQYITTTHNSSTSKTEETNNWDYARTGRFAVLGTVWVGPILHYWYGALFRLLSERVLLRVAVDQFAFAPIFITSFLSILWGWEGDSPAKIPDKLMENVPGIVVANWTLWIPAQLYNFRFVPVKYHVLFSNFVALAWNAYLSYSSHEAKRRDKSPSPQVEQMD